MNRWVRLWSAFVGMVMIGNLQYALTLFAQPMVKAHEQQHWHLSDVQWSFGMFIAAGTWAMLLGDFYGSKNSAMNYSFLYSAKGIASLLGSGIAATLFERTGT